MNEDKFEDIISEERFIRYWPENENKMTRLGERKREYRPYIKCPRCSQWKLAAHIYQKRHRESRGFLRGTNTEWRLANRWWECENCAGTFDVTSTEELDTDDANEDTDNASGDTDNASGTPELYELKLINEGGSNGQIPVDGGEKGIVRRRGHVIRVPAASAKFRLPTGMNLPKGTEVRIERQGDDIYCVEE